MTFEEWLELGKTNKWVSSPVCQHHTGINLTEFERKIIDKDEDAICIFVMRLYETTEEFDEAEKN